MEYNNYSTKADLNSFYNSFHDLEIEDINVDKINEIKQKSEELNYFYEGEFSNFSKGVRYVKVLNKIKTNPKKYNLTNSTEKLLMLMFAVDPSFEAIKIHNEFNKIDDARFDMEKYFGIFDKNLIKIELWYIKNLLDEESKKLLEEEIDKRVYKI